MKRYAVYRNFRFVFHVTAGSVTEAEGEVMSLCPEWRNDWSAISVQEVK